MITLPRTDIWLPVHLLAIKHDGEWTRSDSDHDCNGALCGKTRERDGDGARARYWGYCVISIGQCP